MEGLSDQELAPDTKVNSQEDRRKLILRAAVDVFAERGFANTRMADIAQRAGIAYGLLYHHFDSKDRLLDAVFEENWALFMRLLGGLEMGHGATAKERLVRVADLMIDALKAAPAVVQVVVQEVTRSPRLMETEKLSAFQDAFSIIRRIIERGQREGEFRADLDADVLAHAFFGALEAVCVGAMVGTIRCSTAAEAQKVKRNVTEVMLQGMLVPALCPAQS